VKLGFLLNADREETNFIFSEIIFYSQHWGPPFQFNEIMFDVPLNVVIYNVNIHTFFSDSIVL